jgi:hypothetical protein
LICTGQYVCVCVYTYKYKYIYIYIHTYGYKVYMYIYILGVPKFIHILRDVIYVLLFEVELNYGMNASVTMRQAGQSKKVAEAPLSFEEGKTILNIFLIQFFLS